MSQCTSFEDTLLQRLLCQEEGHHIHLRTMNFTRRNVHGAGARVLMFLGILVLRIPRLTVPEIFSLGSFQLHVKICINFPEAPWRPCLGLLLFQLFSAIFSVNRKHSTFPFFKKNEGISHKLNCKEF